MLQTLFPPQYKQNTDVYQKRQPWLLTIFSGGKCQDNLTLKAANYKIQELPKLDLHHNNVEHNEIAADGRTSSQEEFIVQ